MFTFSKAIFDASFLYKHLRFGLLIFSANLLLTAIWRLGEIELFLFFGDATEVAFFNIANLVAMTVAVLIGQLAAMLIPSLTILHVSGETEQVDAWLGHSLKYFTIASFVFLFTVHALGPWGVKLVWGEIYLPVVANLKVLALGLLAIPLIRTGISLAGLHMRPGELFRVTAGALVTFILVSAVLVPRTGSYGASVAVALALGSAGAITYCQFPLAPALAVARFWRHIFVGFVILGALALSPTSSISMVPLAAICYIALLFGVRIVTTKEIRRIGQAFVT